MMYGIRWLFLVLFAVDYYCSWPVAAENSRPPHDEVTFINSLTDAAQLLLNNQRRSNENGSRDEFRDLCWNDDSNEDIGRYTSQQIISRSGFKYENHYVLANDGYVTQLIRIINPLADSNRLKQPPIMLFHGGFVDSTQFVWSSPIQHKPEKYPRSREDGPIKSWNRSIAFVLANNGYDVWLVGTRGSNEQNQGHIRHNKPKSTNQMTFDPMDFRNPQNVARGLRQIGADRLKYWRFSMDEIVEFELPKQMDKVLELTGAKNVTVLASSLGTMLTLSLFSSNRKYAAKVHSHIQSSPIINNRGGNNLLRYFHSGLCQKLPEEIGIMITSEQISTLSTDVPLAFGSTRKGRYTLGWALYTLFAGPSPTYQALLEPALLGHLYQPIGWRQLKHYCQQVVEGKLQRFDHGPEENLRRYGRSIPPEHNLSQLGVKTWMVVSGGNDGLATQQSVRQILRQSRPKPVEQIFVPSFNHLDLESAVEADKLVNLPILRFLDKYQLPPLTRSPKRSSISRSLRQSRELERFVPRPQSSKLRPNFRHNLAFGQSITDMMQGNLISTFSQLLLSMLRLMQL